MDTFVIILLTAFFLIMIVASYAKRKKIDSQEAIKTEYQSRLKEVPDFTPSELIEGQEALFLFSIDDKNEKIIYIDDENTTCVDYNSIISVELLEEGTVTQKKSTSRTIGGAILGGALIGGVGAVVGGLSGSSTDRKNVSSVIVKILLRNIKTPSIMILCFDSMRMVSKKEIKLGSSDACLYHKGIEQANQIKDWISIIIDKIDSIEKQSNNKISVSYGLSDELLKLSHLKDLGVLTQEEFDTQKNILLSSVVK